MDILIKEKLGSGSMVSVLKRLKWNGKICLAIWNCITHCAAHKLVGFNFWLCLNEGSLIVCLSVCWQMIYDNCVVSENIHMKHLQEIPRGRRVSKAKIIKESMNWKWNFQGNREVQTNRTLCVVRVWVFLKQYMKISANYLPVLEDCFLSQMQWH